MRILFASVEVAPLAKVGGLGDVAAALPPALRRHGTDVVVVMPLHGRIDRAAHDLRETGLCLPVEADGGERLDVAVWQVDLDGVPLYLLEQDRYFGRPEVYGYPDDLERFTFFSRAVLAAGRALRFRPDVLHANDWHTAWLPAWLKLDPGPDGFYGRAAGVLTIHNLAFQGWFDEPFRGRWDVAPGEALEETVGGVSLWSAMALGLRHADAITAVSPSYAQEILTSELGEGLDPLLAARKDRLFGILNGIDVAALDPARDPAIAPHYDRDSLDRKQRVKAALQREAGLPIRPDVPLVGMVTRLTEQKGLDLVAPALEALLAERELQVVVLGSGEPRFEAALTNLAHRHGDAISVTIRFDPGYAQRIYAAADLFLMPSRFEPCGIGQMIALRYGSVPVVRATGGLRDTVFAWRDERAGNGFLFTHYAPESLLVALAGALEVYRLPAVWREVQRRGMAADHSWERSAERYLEVYRFAARAARRGAADTTPPAPSVRWAPPRTPWEASSGRSP